jgi:pyruvyltransferase
MRDNFSEILYYIFIRLPKMLKGKFLHNIIKVHWGRGLNNFGDCLAPYILSYYGLTPVYVPSLAKTDIVLAGTILQLLPSSYSGYIIGTGGDKKDYVFPNASILAVRGELTQNNLRLSSVKLGDAGLLMSYVFPQPVKKKYDLGIIPHFVDENDLKIKLWRSRFANEKVLFINPLEKPERVINKIKSCNHIISSSLHGLIIADAFQIPNNRFINRNTMPNDFYDYKFNDYYSSLGIRGTFIEIDGQETLEKLIMGTNLKPENKIRSLTVDLNHIMINIAVAFKK